MIVCGTGHRLQDMPCKFDVRHPFKLEKIKQIRKHLKQEKYQCVISGMAIGWDTWLAWAAVKENVPLHAYVPFEGQEKRWSKEHQEQFHWLLERAEQVVHVCEPGYASWKMHKRNEAMLAKADKVLALWNPEKRFGGTWSTVASATSMGKPILNFWENPETYVSLI